MKDFCKCSWGNLHLSRRTFCFGAFSSPQGVNSDKILTLEKAWRRDCFPYQTLQYMLSPAELTYGNCLKERLPCLPNVKTKKNRNLEAKRINQKVHHNKHKLNHNPEQFHVGSKSSNPTCHKRMNIKLNNWIDSPKIICSDTDTTPHDESEDDIYEI